jgi:hypothetical protein
LSFRLLPAFIEQKSSELRTIEELLKVPPGWPLTAKERQRLTVYKIRRYLEDGKLKNKKGQEGEHE